MPDAKATQCSERYSFVGGELQCIRAPAHEGRHRFRCGPYKSGEFDDPRDEPAHELPFATATKVVP